MSEANFADIGAAAGEADNLTEEKSTFTPREPAREGVALLRLRDYIELGYYDNKNPKFKPAMACLLTFELLHPDHMLEINGEQVPDTVTIRVNYAGKSTSNYRKLFNAMNWSGKFTHFSQMLGQAFLGRLIHNKVGDKLYVNLNDANGWTISAPRVTDPLTNETKEVPIPELHGTSKLFLWENPGLTEEMIVRMWESIFIDGETNEGKSKNWIQNTIRGSNGWEGSATQSAVDGKVEMPVTPTATTPADLPEEASDPTPAASTAPANDDPLASLGL